MKFQQMADCEVGGVCRDTVSQLKKLFEIIKSKFFILNNLVLQNSRSLEHQLESF